MNFRMAEKSLFAILLRSPWWVSFCLVAAVALAARALLPEQYVPYGVMGGLPFLVIGCIAAWRQLRAPSAHQMEAALARANAMNWRDFSAALEKAWQGEGFTVERLNGAAADFRLVKGGRMTLVAAKRWKAVNAGVEPLRELVAARESQNADLCSFTSLGTLSDSALRFARANKVELMPVARLAGLIGGK